VQGSNQSLFWQVLRESGASPQPAIIDTLDKMAFRKGKSGPSREGSSRSGGRDGPQPMSLVSKEALSCFSVWGFFSLVG
jgi:hypothetical protein